VGRYQLGGLGAGIAATANWVTNAVVSQTFLSLLHYVGKGPTFWIYTGVACLGMLWVYCVLPETKGAATSPLSTFAWGGYFAHNLPLCFLFIRSFAWGRGRVEEGVDAGRSLCVYRWGKGSESFHTNDMTTFSSLVFAAQVLGVHHES
jgi:Sugar (and other) transporter